MTNRAGLWLLGATAVLALVVLVVSTLIARRRAEVAERADEHVWKQAFHLAAELASGRSFDWSARALHDLVRTTNRPILVATAFAIVVRQEQHPDSEIYRVVNRSGLADRLRPTLRAGVANERVEVLEIVEVLRLHALFADAALATRDTDAKVVRAACDAVTSLDPATGLSVLIGLAGKHESWVIDSIGRAVRQIDASRGTVPLARDTWRAVPMLAGRAIAESAMLDEATVTEAVATLIGALDSDVSSMRLAAISALIGTVEHHPPAQLALAGALGSPDRMVRFAAAAALSDSVIGRTILRSVASGDESDASRIAVEVLWTRDPVLTASPSAS